MSDFDIIDGDNLADIYKKFQIYKNIIETECQIDMEISNIEEIESEINGKVQIVPYWKKMGISPTMTFNIVQHIIAILINAHFSFYSGKAQYDHLIVNYEDINASTNLEEIYITTQSMNTFHFPFNLKSVLSQQITINDDYYKSNLCHLLRSTSNDVSLLKDVFNELIQRCKSRSMFHIN